MKCKLCGNKFDKDMAVQSCGNCPLIKDCTLIRCPNCNYEWPIENDNDINKYVSLISLKNGEKGRIVNICTLRSNHLRTIISMGIMPNLTIKMIRRFPTILCQIGYGKFALDEEIAKYVLVIKE